MSVQSEITRLSQAKAAIRNAIIAKGVDVPASAPLDDLAYYISLILIAVYPENIAGYNSTSGVAIRGTALMNTESTPSVNGTINWNFE